ncbi:MAG: hypothetical protein CMD07_05345 [Flavobacteriales bacterium]|nr:hypothetical protein [Flavobacteriales bacterium]
MSYFSFISVIILISLINIVFIIIFINLKINTISKKIKNINKTNFKSRPDMDILKIQSLERLVLFMERIKPENILIRIQKNNSCTSRVLYKILIKTIREEFEHNMSQQLYISDESWELITFSKNQLISLINSKLKEIDPNSNSSELSKVILEECSDKNKIKIYKTISLLKNELNR